MGVMWPRFLDSKQSRLDDISAVSDFGDGLLEEAEPDNLK